MADADTTPPGSTESFNDFKDRILDAVTGIQAENQGHNTVIVSHSKALGVMDAWRHAGMPEDNSIHMPTFEADNIKPGGHEEYKIPEHVMLDKMEIQPSSLIPLDRDIGFDQQGNPLRLSTPDPLNLGHILDTNPIDNPEVIAGMSRGYWTPGGKGFEAITKLAKEGKTTSQIADEIGISPGNVYNYIKRHGIEYNPTKENLKSPGVSPDEETASKMYEMFNKGSSFSEIAKAFNTTRGSVAGKIDRYRKSTPIQEPTTEVTLPKLKFLEKELPE